MTENLKSLCSLYGVSGRENAVRDYIIGQIKDYSEITVDPLGNIIAKVTGRKRSQKTVMADAHMDEVGIIITSVSADGTLKFACVGGIDTSVLIARRVCFADGTVGVICAKPVHMLSGDEKTKMPEKDSLYIDIGADSKESAEKLVHPGDTAVFDTKPEALGDLIISKALDDRVGCAVLIDIIQDKPEYDFYATFTVQEEVGLRGAKTAAYSVNPDFAVAVEATTASDIAGVPEDKKVCRVGMGAVLSFMDLGTMYDRGFFEFAKNTAESEGIPYQIKCAVAGGNNAGAIHLSRGGVRTLAVSLPCRYIHSPSCVASEADIDAVRELTKSLINKAAAGDIT